MVSGMLLALAVHMLGARYGLDLGGLWRSDSKEFMSASAAIAWWLVDPRADGSHPARGPAVTDFEELLDTCAAGGGLGLASTFAVTNYQRPGLTFVRLDDVEDARTALCWRADETDPAVRTFVATVRRLAREQAVDR